MKSPYGILGVPEGSAKDVCKKAYRKLASMYHPDNAGGSSDKFEEVTKAWEAIERGVITLSDYSYKRRGLRHASLFSFV